MGKDKKRIKKIPTSDCLDEQTFSYYMRVSETINGEFESDEKKAVFISSVLKAVSEEALNVCKDKTVSVIVENLLRLAKRNQLVAILTNFSEDWESACCDRSTSFVTQSLLLHLNKYLGEGDCDSDIRSDEKSIEDLINGLFEFLKSQVALYMQHVSASHVLRVFMEVLAGCQVSEMIIRGKSSQQRPSKQIQLKKPLSVYQEKLYDLCNLIVNLPKLEDHTKNNLSNPVLQTILLSLKSFDEGEASNLCQKMVTNGNMFSSNKSEDEMPAILTHEIGSRLAEQCLVTMPPDVYQKTWETHFKGRLLTIAKHPVANFVVQKLISRARTVEQFSEMFEELLPELETILGLNHFGVIVALTEASVKHKSVQGNMIKCLQQAFHCHSPAERQCKLVPLLMSLLTYEMFYQLDKLQKDNSDDSEESDAESGDDEEQNPDNDNIALPKVTSVNFHGSVIIQHLLKFNNPRPVVSSLFELKPGELKNVCCDPCGSHVVEVFLTSVTVGEKSRDMLYNKLKGLYLELACNKSGSRTFDALWNHATMKQKIAITEELAKQEDKLKANRFGFFIHSKCAIPLFKQRPDHWKNAQSSLTKKRKVDNDVPQDSGSKNFNKKAKFS